MKLAIGITAVQPQWSLLSGQIGFPFSPLSSTEEISHSHIVTIIVSAKGSDNLRKNLLSYIHSGGSLLMEAPEAEWLFGIKSQRRYVDYIQPRAESLFGNVLPGFIDASLTVPEEADDLFANDGMNLVEIVREGKGSAVILPGGLTGLLLNSDIRRRQFPSVSRYLPTERVARCSKHTIREIVQYSLEFLSRERKLPFVSLHPFPEGKPSCFNLRIDTDFADEKYISDLYDLCRKHTISASWFVETGSARKRLSQFEKMKDQEIGLHCFQHKVFKNYYESETDIKHGKSLLTGDKISPSGYAAPFGEWNSSLAKAVESSGFKYSSEFGLAYDDHPFYPWLGDRFSSVLQLPVHPISAGRLKNAKHNEENIKHYFAAVMDTNSAHWLPIFIYDHPSSANLDVLNWFMEQIQEKEISSVTLGGYAEWWKIRDRIKWGSDISTGKLTIKSSGIEKQAQLLLKNSDGSEAVTPMSDVITFNELDWQESTSLPAIVPMAVRNRISRKMLTNNFDHIRSKINPWK